MVYGHAGGTTYEQLVDSVQSFQQRGYKVIRVQHGGYSGPRSLRTVASNRPMIPNTTIFEPVPYLIRHSKDIRLPAQTSRR